MWYCVKGGKKKSSKRVECYIPPVAGKFRREQAKQIHDRLSDPRPTQNNQFWSLSSTHFWNIFFCFSPSSSLLSLAVSLLLSQPSREFLHSSQYSGLDTTTLENDFIFTGQTLNTHTHTRLNQKCAESALLGWEADCAEPFPTLHSQAQRLPLSTSTPRQMCLQIHKQASTWGKRDGLNWEAVSVPTVMP